MDNKSRDLELEKRIDAYIKGNLSEEESRKLWEELLKNPEYIDLLNTELAVRSIYEEGIRSTSTVSDDTVKRVSPSWHASWKWIAAAAAIVLLVVAVNILQHDTNQNLQKSAIKEINIVENLSTAQVVRSQAAGLSKQDSLLNAGFNRAIAGNSSQAIKIYNQIIADFGDQRVAMQAYLNKGIMQYNAGNFTNAAHSFATVLSVLKDPISGITKEKAYWYLGNAYINMDNLHQAREAIQHVNKMDSNYQEKAHRLLKKIDDKLGSTSGNNSDSQIKE